MTIRWVAFYKNGEYIPQSKTDNYASLDHNNLVGLEVYCGDKHLFTQHIEPQQRLIWRRRVEQRVIDNTPTQILYLCGVRERVNTINGPKTIQHIAYLFEKPDGGVSIHVAGKFDRERNSFFYSPHLLYHEVFVGEKYWKQVKVQYIDNDGEKQHRFEGQEFVKKETDIKDGTESKT